MVIGTTAMMRKDGFGMHSICMYMPIASVNTVHEQKG